MATLGASGTASLTVQAPTPVPTLPEWAMILMGLMLAGGAAAVVQRHRTGA
ncbi:IPTL-CTERM sorting domain-containing protein [Brevundimonas sp.]|uniref:IPTL-CTERM sorting domain-containing protein n=1 Tax=Brevundimonas sp. TaxID=1871086 RepID=UPI003D0A4224